MAQLKSQNTSKHLGTNEGSYLSQRPRRNRRMASIRQMVRETALLPSDLILPLFVTSKDKKEKIPSMPGIYRHSMESLIHEAQKAFERGIPGVLLFPALEDFVKDEVASEAINPHGLLQKAIRAIKRELPKLCVISDVAMDPYSIHGHDGLWKDDKVLNDETIDILAAMAVNQARSGVDYVAPSDMMDGRVGAIREALDREGFSNVGIISYGVKYASSFYGPFREALSSAPKHGDKKTYQMDPANSKEAVREMLLDENQGADILVVKPALAYLDIIAKVKDQVQLPVATYHVSGEYAMIKAASERSWIDGEKVMLETHLAMKRAGADIIFTYSAIEIAEILHGS